MKRFLIILIVLTDLGVSCTKPEEKSPVDADPVVTISATNVSCISATLTGKANLGKTMSEDLKLGFMLSTSSGVIVSTSNVVEADNIDGDYRFVTVISTLAPSTKYYYRSFVYQAGEYSYGDTKSFTTKSVKSLITASDANSISPVSAKVFATLDLTNVKYNTITNKGFRYGSNNSSSDVSGIITNDQNGRQNGAIEATLKNLAPNTTYWYAPYITLDGKKYQGDTTSFTTKGAEGLIETKDATSIGPTTATLNGMLDLTDCSYSYLSYGFCYSEGETDNPSTFVTSNNRQDKEYSLTLSNLLSGRIYSYSACVRFNSGGSIRYLGDVKSFTTETLKISIDELTVSNIGITKATVSGKILVEPSGTYSIIGNLYYKKRGSYVYDKVTLPIAADGSFSVSLNNLSSDTEYIYYLDATVAGISYKTEDNSFKTNAINATVATLEATNVDIFKSTIHGSLSLNNSEELNTTVWFLYSSSASTLDALKASGAKVTVSLQGNGSYAANLTSLSSGTTFYYMACASVYDKEYYGEVKLFSTLNIDDLVTVTTNAASDIKYFEATLNGTLMVNTSENLTKSVWFLWSKTANNVTELKRNGAQIQCSLNNNGSYSAVLNTLSYNTWYYFMAVAKVNGTVIYGKVTSFQTKNIPEVVDLGLSVKWRSRNLGASKPEDYGDYYAWGETSTKSSYLWSNYKWGEFFSNGESNITKYKAGRDNSFEYYGYEDDVASVKLGSKWHIPTATECRELIYNCTCTWTNDFNCSGRAGMIVSSNKAGYTDMFIFLPAAGYRRDTILNEEGLMGYYWSSWVSGMSGSLSSDGIIVSSKNGGLVSDFGRGNGLSVRPVTE